MKVKKNIILITIGLIVVVGVLVGLFILMQSQLEKKVAQRFYLAMNLAEEEKWKEAATIFKEIFEKYPKSKRAPASIFHYALSLEKLGKADEAYAYLEKIIKEFPESHWLAQSLLVQARMKKGEGFLLEAENFYKKVINEFKEPSFIEEAWLGLGDIYAEKGELLEAKNLYKKVMEEYPKGDFYSSAQERLGNLTIKMIFSSSPSIGSLIYKVGSGDTLNNIARRFNTTVDLIKEGNQLEVDYLSVGKRLKLTPCNFNIIVSKAKNILELRYNGELIKIYPVATGKFGGTPTGDFKITNKLKNPDWYRQGRRIPSGHPDNILGTRWLGISEASYGIHGTTQPETIGSQTTEGCVRMLNQDVEEIYKLVTVGTPVKIVE